MEKEAHWKKVVAVKYGVLKCGWWSLPNITMKSGGPWRDILKVKDVLASRISFIMSNDLNTKMWENNKNLIINQVCNPSYATWDLSL